MTTKLLTGDWITIDGSTGAVYVGVVEPQVNQVDEQDPYQVLMRAWHNLYLGEEPTLPSQVFEIGLPIYTTVSEATRKDFMQESRWWPEIELGLNLNTVVADFYLLNHAVILEPSLQPVFQQYAELVARQLALYLDAAIGGEARHKHGGYKSASGITLSKTGGRALARNDWRHIRVAEGIQAVKDLRTSFFGMGWGGAVGGKRWGQIADVLWRFLNNEITASVFIDLAFDLQHNCGVVFNKLGKKHVYSTGQSVGWQQEHLQTLLSLKFQDAFDQLRTYASSEMLNLLDNYTENDTVVVKGLDFMDSVWQAAVTYGTTDITVGSTVQVTHKSKKQDLVGLSGVVTAVKDYPNKQGKSLLYAKVTFPDGRKLSLSLNNIQSVDTVSQSTQKYRQYYTIAQY